jgi:DNA-binding NarL/FixJ family response regulator
MEVLSKSSRRDGVPAHVVLNALAELSAAIDAMRHEIAKHGIFMPDAPPGQACAPTSSDPEALIGDLSKRQRQVLAGIVRGCANKVIAWELGLSVRTVEAYRAQLFERLGARNAADAVRLALAAGIGEAEDLASAG